MIRKSTKFFFFFKQLTKELLIKNEATTDKPFQSSLWYAEWHKIAREMPVLSTFLDFSNKQEKALQFNISKLSY